MCWFRRAKERSLLRVETLLVIDCAYSDDAMEISKADVKRWRGGISGLELGFGD